MEIDFIRVSLELDKSGLIWLPEIGDEVAERDNLERVSIFVDPQGLTPKELRRYFVWLPTVEQLIEQFEARQAMLYHAGITESFCYEAVVRTSVGLIETSASNLRLACAQALFELLRNGSNAHVH